MKREAGMYWLPSFGRKEVLKTNSWLNRIKKPEKQKEY